VRVGVLTGGGDCPGLNAVIRAIVRQGERTYGDELVGFLDAWDGVRGRKTVPLTIETMRGTLPRGGTVLGTKRGSPFDTESGVDEVAATIADLGLDSIVVIGGNGSLTVASRLFEERALPIVGVPKTIDNDIEGTDVTFGFHTAVQIATDAIDRLHTTAESHDRVMVVEVMGRHSGWIATYAGIAGGATMVVIPEIPFDIDEICRRLSRRHERNRFASIVVVAEGAEPKPGTMDVEARTYDRFGHVLLGGISDVIAREIAERTGFETRVVMLGHVQRGGTPTAYDRVLCTRFGVAAINLVHQQGWGQMVVARGGEIVSAPLSVATGRSKPVDPTLFDVAQVFFA
jgi:ATP-dependent phosphofructokinase / diphosphate-dependent phosphofructokinase